MGILTSEYDLDSPAVVSVIDDVPLWSAPFGLKLLEVVRMRRNMRALDVGSGLGFPVIELSQRLGPTCQVYGIDPWVEANERARHKLSVWELANVKIVDGAAERLPFEDRHFDLVVSNNGTNNVDDEEVVYREIARVAKPGAQIVLTMNLPDTMKEFYDVYREVLKTREMHDVMERLEAHIHERRKPLSHTRASIERAGLQIVEIHHDSFLLRYTDGSAMLESPFIKLAFLEPWKEVLPPSKVEPVFRAAEEELNRIAGSAGELRLTVPWVCLDLRKAPLP
jgi:ubiquinone/menaquinone biosynthesis C-methylase UbiE